VWNAFWAGGSANPLEVIEQITYLPFTRARCGEPSAVRLEPFCITFTSIRAAIEHNKNINISFSGSGS
jgi:hypothetical protein